LEEEERGEKNADGEEEHGEWVVDSILHRTKQNWAYSRR
jgi:hypothetical protein